MMRPDPHQEADSEMAMMSFKPQAKKPQKKKPQVPPTVEQIAEKVCTTMGTQLLKGLESRLDQIGQKLSRPRRKPGPWRAKKGNDGTSASVPSQPQAPTPNQGQSQLTKKSDASPGNVERLPSQGKPPRQPEN